MVSKSKLVIKNNSKMIICMVQVMESEYFIG